MVRRIVLAIAAVLAITAIAVASALAQTSYMPGEEGEDWFQVVASAVNIGSDDPVSIHRFTLPADGEFKFTELGLGIDVSVSVAVATTPNGQTKLLEETMAQMNRLGPFRILIDTRNSRTFVVNALSLDNDYEVVVTLDDVQFHIGPTPMRDWIAHDGRAWVRYVQKAQAIYFAQNGRYGNFKELSSNPICFGNGGAFEDNEREALLVKLGCLWRISLPQISDLSYTVVARNDDYGITVTGDMTGEIVTAFDEEGNDGED